MRRWIRARRPALDVALALAIAVVGAALGLRGFIGAFSVLPDDVSSWWTLATAIPAALLLAFRGRAPMIVLAAAVVVAAVDLVTTGGLVPLVVVLDLLFVATREAPAPVRRRILVGVVAAVVALTIASVVITADPRVGAVVALQFGALLGLSYWYGTAVGQSRELVALHRRRADDARLLAERDRAAAVEGERETMARELHDLVAGHVSAMAIRAEAALASPVDPVADRAALRAVRDSGLEAHEALRTMIAVLRAGTGAVTAPPRRAEVPAMVDEARRAGLDVHVSDEVDGVLPAAVDQAAAHIVQEALANCMRHAAGGHVDVRLFDDGAEVGVRVDSRGGEPLASPVLTGSGWGLDLLRERARALGGRVEAGPRAAGWTVEARLPRRVTV